MRDFQSPCFCSITSGVLTYVWPTYPIWLPFLWFFFMQEIHLQMQFNWLWPHVYYLYLKPPCKNSCSYWCCCWQLVKFWIQQCKCLSCINDCFGYEVHHNWLTFPTQTSITGISRDSNVKKFITKSSVGILFSIIYFNYQFWKCFPMVYTSDVTIRFFQSRSDPPPRIAIHDPIRSVCWPVTGG